MGASRRSRLRCSVIRPPTWSGADHAHPFRPTIAIVRSRPRAGRQAAAGVTWPDRLRRAGDAASARSTSLRSCRPSSCSAGSALPRPSARRAAAPNRRASSRRTRRPFRPRIRSCPRRTWPSICSRGSRSTGTHWRPSWRARDSMRPAWSRRSARSTPRRAPTQAWRPRSCRSGGRARSVRPCSISTHPSASRRMRPSASPSPTRRAIGPRPSDSWWCSNR